MSEHGTHSAGKPKPNLVRITYKLKEDPENKGTFILTRQESVPLDWEKNSGKTYEVMTGIKEISVEYTAKIEKTVTIEEEKPEPAKGAQGKPETQPAKPAQPSKKPKTKTEVEYKTVKTWDMDQKEEEKKDEQEKAKEQVKQKPIPVLVKITAKLFDNQLKTVVEFIFFIPIISDTEFTPKRRRGFSVPQFPLPGQQGSPGQTTGQGQQVAHRPPPFNARLYS